MKKALLIVGALVALIALPLGGALLWHRLSPPAPGADSAAGLPWQIERLADGRTRVFGLTLGRSTLADARARFGADAKLALVAGAGEPGAVEAYVDPANAGFVTGRAVFVAAVPADTLAAWRRRAADGERQPSGAVRAALSADDAAEAWRAPIAAISFLPSARLDAEVVRQRFGEPAETRSTGDQTHLLYPERGVAVTLGEKGRTVIQYVAPPDFERLRAPLAAAAVAASAASAPR